jgi:filamentous hemagglutinin
MVPMFGFLQKVLLATLLAAFASQAEAMFIQADWLDPTEPGVGTNRYAYSHNDPTNQIDTNGNSTYVEANEETDRNDDYKVLRVDDDDDLNIYVSNGNTKKDELTILGQTRFKDAFISPDTGKAVGTVYVGLSFDKRFTALGNSAEQMDATSLAVSSLPGMQMDPKSTTDGYSSYSGVLLDGKYMTLREIGNTLAGYNAAGNGQSFDDFQRVSGALQVAGARGALMAATFGTSYGEPPNYGELDYQRTRSEYGYALDRTIVKSWVEK